MNSLRVDVDEDVGPAVASTTRGIFELHRGAQFEEGLVGRRHPVYVEQQAREAVPFSP